VKILTNPRISRIANSVIKIITKNNITKLSFSFLMLVILIAIFGPWMAPYEYDETQYTDDGEIKMTEPPSAEHYLGTTNRGEDVFSRLIIGTQPTVVTGFLGGSIIISIGLLMGVTAGYIGGRVDEALMRITDAAYGLPFIPFALVVIAFFGVGFYTSILLIGVVLWRSSARVLRSQVLQIRERNYVTAAKMTGASTSRIMLRYIFPNIAPMAVLFFALGMGSAIVAEASLAFIGVTSPFVPSWGIMVRNAYNSGTLSAWWWAVPPGLLISTTVAAAFMFGRAYESSSETNTAEGI